MDNQQSKKCKNPLHMYPHYILESKSIQNRVMDRLGYCSVCSSLAFQDNVISTPIYSTIHKPEKNITFIGNDTL